MTKSIAALERLVDQLSIRIRNLESQLAAIRDDSAFVRRGYLEGVLACVETGQTPAAALSALSGADQEVASGSATLLELVNSSGLKLRPVQSSSGGAKATVTYYNCADDEPKNRSSSKNPMLLVRLRNGMFVRFPAGGQQFDVRVKPDGTALQKTVDGGTTWTDWATIRDDCA